MSNDERATLPPLPHPVRHDFTGEDTEDLFTADQMHAYAIQARAAIAQQPAKRDDDERLTSALTLAADRLDMLSVQIDDGTRLHYQVKEWAHAARKAAQQGAAIAQQPAKRCEWCDDTGDVVSITGEWRGRCICPEGAAIAQPAEPVDWRLTAARFLRDEDAQRSHLGYANRTYELVYAAEKLEQLASASPYGLDCADPTLKAAQPAEPAVQYVKVPTDAQEAEEAMLRVSTLWMQQHAPELLRALLRAPMPVPAQADAQPVAYWAQSVHGRVFSAMPGGMGLKWHPLYAAAAPPARQPLTDEQRAVLLFLLGYETLHGLGFGERHPSRPGAFWWRGELDAAFPGLHVGKPMGGIGEGE